jgi:hypothetical protein
VAFTNDSLIAAIKRRAAVPSVGQWSSAEILATADEEMRSYVLPLVRRVQEEHLLQASDYTVISSDAIGQPLGAQYRIPGRAIGGALRDVYLVDSDGGVVRPPRLSTDDLEGATWGLYLFSNCIHYVNRNGSCSAPTLRMTYYLRPSALVLEAAAGRVTGYDANAHSITIAAAPAAFAGQTSFDIVRGRPGFEMLGFDLPGSITGTTVTLTGVLPNDIAVGDWVCLPEESPVPQIPAELHPLLAERVAFTYLKIEDPEAAAASAKTLEEMQAGAMLLLGQRIQGSPKKIVPAANGLFRRGGLW